MLLEGLRKKFRPHEFFKERIFKLVEVVKKNKPDTLVFLDKSARGVFIAFYYAWKSKYPKEKLPNIKFLNIGREEKSFNNINDKDRIEKMKQDILRKQYNPKLKILIVDDVYETGGTVEKATTFLERIFEENNPEVEYLEIFNAGDVGNVLPIWFYENLLGSFGVKYTGVKDVPDSIFSAKDRKHDGYKRLKVKIKHLFS